MSLYLWLAIVVIGIPVVVAVGLPITFYFLRKSRLDRIKMQELKLQEKRLEMEERIRTDELNAKILRMDDLGISPTDLISLREEIRQLREEVAQIKQQVSGH